MDRRGHGCPTRLRRLAPGRRRLHPHHREHRHRPVYLRKEIEVAKPVRRATVFFSGLGFSELYLDGRKVGDYVVGPGFTTYNKRAPYLAFDVTDRFAQTGRKALGVILVDGWYGNGYGHGFEKNVYVDKPKLRLNLHLEHPDGTETVVVSDGSWKWSDGEITRSGIVQEDIDRRQARPGWDQAGCDESGWRPVAVVKGPEGRLVHQKEAALPDCRGDSPGEPALRPAIEDCDLRFRPRVLRLGAVPDRPARQAPRSRSPPSRP